MAKLRQTKTVDKWKRKKWYDLIAPNYLNNKVIGHTPTIDVNKLVGKKITDTLMNVTGDMRQRNIQATFEVIQVKENKGHTRLFKYELTPSSVKRLIRRRRSRVDDSFVCKTQDSVHVRVKPLVITNSVVSRAVQKALRQKTIDFLVSYVSNNTYEHIIQELIRHKLQRELSSTLKKITPLRNSEVRLFKIETTQKMQKKALIAKEQPKTEETKEEVETEEKTVEKVEAKKEPIKEELKKAVNVKKIEKTTVKNTSK
ncbi:hypothetical protein GOV04_01415 [Candidatus Woesearchaeota archaeon]|nr:hypothetical protein [Candidatus Woesearchaeota archaeon]